MQVTWRRSWQLLKQLMVKKGWDLPINVSKHISWETEWEIQFLFQSRPCLSKDSTKTLLVVISGKAVNKLNVRVILDDDPDIWELYPLTKDKEHNYQDSIEFIGEPTDLFYLQTEEVDWTRFNAATGYEVWHQRLGHVMIRNIDQTIQHSIGLESLVGKKYRKDHKCPSGMIRKSTFENYPWPEEPDSRPMALVHMDVHSSSVTSIEGYDHGLIITNSCS